MNRYVTVRGVLLPVLLCAAMAGHAQQTQQPDAQQQMPPPPKGRVLFERHDNTLPQDGQPADVTSPEAEQPTGISTSARRPHTLKRRDTPSDAAQTDPPVSSSATEALPRTMPEITEADRVAAAKVMADQRAALLIVSTDIDLHLHTHDGDAEAQAKLRVRNAGTSPLTAVVLRVSGALQWDGATVNGTKAAMEQHHLRDDLDHTGVATEVVLPLQEPLAAGAEVDVELFYSGSLSDSDERLLALGAPAEAALRTDWDMVTDTFTGLRGIGNVLWYPVSGPVAMLRDGDAVSRAVSAARAQDASWPFRLRLTVLFAGEAPDAAFFCGERKPLKVEGEGAGGADTAMDAGAERVATAEWDRKALGPHTPSLFLATGAPQSMAVGLLRVVTDHADTASALGEAARKLRPMMQEWLGAAPRQVLDVIDLPVPGAAAFADGGLLVSPLTAGSASALAPGLVGPLAQVWLPQDVDAAWLREGIPAFLQAVYAERTQGRATAMQSLSAMSATLKSQAAPVAKAPAISSSSDAAPADASLDGPALASCLDAACARAKAAYVFEMLRGMLGDGGLAQTISGWSVTEQQTGPTTAQAETAAFEKLTQQAAGKADLSWFFKSWVEENHGLPDLTIVTVAPRRVERAQRPNYLPPQKKAYSGPIGAEPVPQPGDPDDRADRAAAGITPGNKIAPAPGSWLVAVEVQNNGSADAEVPVTVRAGSLTNTLPLRIPAHGRATIRVPFEADPQEVLVNDGSVPEARVTEHRRSIGSLR